MDIMDINSADLDDGSSTIVTVKEEYADVINLMINCYYNIH